jgi:hypothetical protein
MKERPILFSGPMVRAILEGKKTQTRRVVRPQPILKPCADEKVGHAWHWKKGRREAIWWEKIATPMSMLQHCPYGGPGDRLWVRETWYSVAENDQLKPTKMPHGPNSEQHWGYVAGLYNKFSGKVGKPGKPQWAGKTRASIHMPRWASRLTLEVTGVRVERLQDITEDDIVAEGISLIKGKGWHNPVDNRCYPRAEWAFQYLWDSINAKRGFGWEVNPWVWVVSFPRMDSGKETSP